MMKVAVNTSKAFQVTGLAACELGLSILKTFKTTPVGIIKQILTALNDIVLDENENAGRLGNGGIAEILEEILNTAVRSDHTEVVLYTIELMGSLTSCSVENKNRFGIVGMCNLLVKAMRQYLHRNVNIARCVLITTRSLAFSDHNEMKFIQVGAAEVLIASALKFEAQNHIEFLALTFETIQNLTSSPETQLKFHTKEFLTLLVRTVINICPKKGSTGSETTTIGGQTTIVPDSALVGIIDEPNRHLLHATLLVLKNMLCHPLIQQSFEQYPLAEAIMNYMQLYCFHLHHPILYELLCIIRNSTCDNMSYQIKYFTLGLSPLLINMLDQHVAASNELMCVVYEVIGNLACHPLLRSSLQEYHILRKLVDLLFHYHQCIIAVMKSTAPIGGGGSGTIATPIPSPTSKPAINSPSSQQLPSTGATPTCSAFEVTVGGDSLLKQRDVYYLLQLTIFTAISHLIYDNLENQHALACTSIGHFINLIINPSIFYQQPFLVMVKPYVFQIHQVLQEIVNRSSSISTEANIPYQEPTTTTTTATTNNIPASLPPPPQPPIQTAEAIQSAAPIVKAILEMPSDITSPMKSNTISTSIPGSTSPEGGYTAENLETADMDMIVDTNEQQQQQQQPPDGGNNNGLSTNDHMKIAVTSAIVPKETSMVPMMNSPSTITAARSGDYEDEEEVSAPSKPTKMVRIDSPVRVTYESTEVKVTASVEQIQTQLFFE